MMNAIGGYHALELNVGEHYHKDAIPLNTARNCLEYILKSRQYTKVFVPYYTCDAIIEPFTKLNISYEFYRIDKRLEPRQLPNLNRNEAFLYTNYFGLKNEYLIKLANHYGHQLIVDNSQAFFDRPISGIDTFYSPRKFFGVPDGGFLYTDCKLNTIFEQDVSFTRALHLLKRIDISPEAGYEDFKNAEQSLSNQPIKRMSKLTDSILRNIDYIEHIKRRRANYLELIDILGSKNELVLELSEDSVPLAYPFKTKKTDLKNLLISKRIFIPTYWPNIKEWCKQGEFEFELMTAILPLPLTHSLKPQLLTQLF